MFDYQGNPLRGDVVIGKSARRMIARAHASPSSDSAAAVAEASSTSYKTRIYYYVLANGPMTVDEIGKHFIEDEKWARSTPSARASELIRDGFLFFTGQLNHTESDILVPSYKAVPEKEAHLIAQQLDGVISKNGKSSASILADLKRHLLRDYEEGCQLMDAFLQSASPDKATVVCGQLYCIEQYADIVGVKLPHSRPEYGIEKVG